MLEQVSVSVKYFAHFIESKLGKTGLTVTVDVWAPDNTKIVNNAAATEIGGGLYCYTLSGTLTATEGDYPALFKTATTTVDQREIPALWTIGRAGIERLDANIGTRASAADLATLTGYVDTEVNAIKTKTDNLPSDPADHSLIMAAIGAVWDTPIAAHVTAGSVGQALSAAGAAGDPLLNVVPGSYASGTAGAALGKIGTGTIETTSPVTTGGNVTIIRGDSYKAEDARALEWLIDDLPEPFETPYVVIQGSAYSAAVVDGKIRLELTSEQTSAFRCITDDFGIYGYQGTGDRVTVLRGKFTVESV